MPSNMPDARAVNEALRRAREMQSRSARTPPSAPQNNPESDPVPESPPVPAPQTTAKKPPSPLDFLMQDKERTLILALLILLSSEKNNTELLFVLMYLLI